MAGTFTNLIFHVVFSTKFRAPVILNDFKEELYAYVGGIAKGETKTKTENPHKKNQERLFVSLNTDDIIVASGWDLICISLEK